MTPRRLFFWSLIGLAISVLGFLGFIFLGFAFFTYQGNGMDWIYPVGGLFVSLGLASVVVAIISGVLSIKEAREEKESNSPPS
jgi:uncharacterized membrane protein